MRSVDSTDLGTGPDGSTGPISRHQGAQPAAAALAALPSAPRSRRSNASRRTSWPRWRRSSRARARPCSPRSPCCSPRAICSSRMSPASARRCSRRRWPARSTRPCAASSSPRTCSPAISLACRSTTRRAATSSSAPARSSPISSSATRSTGLAEDPVRPPGCMEESQVTVGGTTYPPRAAVHGHGHSEPDRDGGHLPPPGGPARPVHGPDLHGVPLRSGGDGHAAHPRGTTRSTPCRRPPTRRRSRRPSGSSSGSMPARRCASMSSTSSRQPGAPRALRLGASPRASLHLLRASRAHAAVAGRDHVLPDDVRQVAQPVLAHRFIVATDSAGVRRPDQVLRDLLGALPVPTSAR